MQKQLTPSQVKEEIYDRIEKELKKANVANLRNLIYEKPWCTGGKGEEVAIIETVPKSNHAK